MGLITRPLLKRRHSRGIRLDRLSSHGYGLKLWYPCSEGGGASGLSSLKSFSQVSVSGMRLASGVTIVPLPGRDGLAVDFNGTTGVADIVQTGTIAGPWGLSCPFTVAAWVITDVVPSATRVIASVYDASNTDRHWFFGLDASAKPTFTKSTDGAGGGSSATATGTTALVSADTLVYQHLCITCDASGNWAWYRNGKADGTGSFSTTIFAVSATSTVPRLGGVTSSSLSPDLFWDGRIIDFRTYSRALSAGEVMSLFQPTTRWGLYAQEAVFLPGLPLLAMSPANMRGGFGDLVGGFINA